MTDGVGMKLMCDLNAANANRMRRSSYTGVLHLMVSFAFGATARRMARSSRRWVRASCGAFEMYSATVAALIFGMAARVPAAPVSRNGRRLPTAIGIAA